MRKPMTCSKRRLSHFPMEIHQAHSLTNPQQPLNTSLMGWRFQRAWVSCVRLLLVEAVPCTVPGVSLCMGHSQGPGTVPNQPHPPQETLPTSAALSRRSHTFLTLWVDFLLYVRLPCWPGGRKCSPWGGDEWGGGVAPRPGWYQWLRKLDILVASLPCQLLCMTGKALEVADPLSVYGYCVRQQVWSGTSIYSVVTCTII